MVYCVCVFETPHVTILVFAILLCNAGLQMGLFKGKQVLLGFLGFLFSDFLLSLPITKFQNVFHCVF